jgi:hypothetical protein
MFCRFVTILMLSLVLPVFPRLTAAEDRPAEAEIPSKASEDLLKGLRGAAATDAAAAEDVPARASQSGAVGSGSRSPGDSGTVQLFGIAATGHKFVYVFDRSGSMGGDGRRALAVAKKELLSSLDGLESTQQFQLIFYNESPLHFNPAGQAGRLGFATDENKQRARRFIEQRTAGGGTDHEKAIRLAINLRPDVIFLLTDADEPRLSSKQLEDIRRWAAGIIIHVVEIGPGPDPGGDSFLRRLARENGGRHVYVDASQRVPAGGDSRR